MRNAYIASLPLLLVVVGAGCGSTKAAGQEEAESAPGARVDGSRLILVDDSPQLPSLTSVIAGQSARRRASFNGRLVWNEDVTVRIFSPFAGRVASVLVDAGQSVCPGDALATIAAPDFGQAQADARRAGTDLELAQRTLARLTDLLQHGVVAQKDLDAARADAERARAEQQRAEVRLKLYGDDSPSVNQLFSLKTPLGGVVVERNLNPGQEVRPDQMLANAPQLFSPLFTVSDPAKLWVQLDVPERDLQGVNVGAGLVVRTLGWPDRVFPGRVTLVASSVDPGTRTLKVRGTVENPERLLKAEMLVTVDLPGALPSRPAVPSAAVVLEGDTQVVFVEEARGRYRRAEVRVGSEEEGMVEVESGLHAGERVVTAGSLLLEHLYQSLGHS